jgi:hypothetical protein
MGVEGCLCFAMFIPGGVPQASPAPASLFMRSYHDLLSRRERGVIDAKGKSVGSVRNIKLVEPVDIIQDICRILQATVSRVCSRSSRMT